MKAKFLAAVAALAVASSASAAPIGVEGIFFTAFDGSNNRSIIINTGLSTATFNATGSFDLSLFDAGAQTALNNWIAASSNTSEIVWGVMGVSNGLFGSPTYGGLSTSTNLGTFATTGGDWGSLGTVLNVVAGTSTTRSLANPSLAGVNAASTSGSDFYNTPSNQGPAGFISTTGIGGSMAFYRFFADQPPLDPDFGGSYAVVSPSGYTWSLTGSAGSYNVTYGNPVPLPAAAWLLLSGLAGFVGVARRKTAQ
jgi:hypothetical protein